MSQIEEKLLDLLASATVRAERAEQKVRDMEAAKKPSLFVFALSTASALVAAGARQDKIIAIKAIRDATGASLKDAKDAIEATDFPRQLD